MYYEEGILNSVLHYRTTPEGEWYPVSPERLTAIIVQLRKDIKDHCVQMETFIHQLR
jgi:hypothetical protein